MCIRDSRGAVQQVTGRGSDFHNAIPAAVLAAGTSRACRVNVIFSADRHVHIKPSKAAFVGGAAFCQLCTGVQQLCSVRGLNVIHGVEFIHRAGQIGQSLSILLVKAYTDFADLIAGLFGRGAVSYTHLYHYLTGHAAGGIMLQTGIQHLSLIHIRFIR